MVQIDRHRQFFFFTQVTLHDRHCGLWARSFSDDIQRCMTLPPVMGQRIFSMSGSIARCDFSISLAQRLLIW
jgi:hypothetical protein